MLTKLPPEILDLIARLLTNKRDLRSLSLVSRLVHFAVERALWDSLDLSPAHEEALWRFRDKSLFGEHLPAFRLPTKVNFRSTFNRSHGERCPHHCDLEGPTSRYDQLGHVAESVLQLIPSNRLRNFTWDMGTCVPGQLLTSGGMLARQHPNIQSLSLTTAGDCMDWTVLDLSPFRKIQTLCWKAPRYDNLRDIATVVRNNRKHLFRLELDLVNRFHFADQLDQDYDSDDVQEVCKDMFGRLILSTNGLLPKWPLFPVLRELSLNSLSLVAENAHAFNLKALKSLTLRKCRGWIPFIEEIVRLNVPLQLETLEIQERNHPLGGNPYFLDNVLALLSKIEGLEELFLAFSKDVDALKLWDEVAKRHRKTLKRFVHHQQTPNRHSSQYPAHPDGLFSLGLDVPDFDLGAKAGQVHKENPLAMIDHPESFGLSCIPEMMGPIFSSLGCTRTTPQRPAGRSLKLLHIRQSPQNRACFGSWVTFGNDVFCHDDGGFRDPSLLLAHDPDQVTHDPFVFVDRQPIPAPITRYVPGGSSSLTADDVGTADEAREIEQGVNQFRALPVPTEPIARCVQGLAGGARREWDGTLFDIQDIRDHLTDQLRGPVVLRDAMRRFANWAFGERGLETLQVIVLGDWGHGRVRPGIDNLFLVRRKGAGDESTGNSGDNYTIHLPAERGSQDWAELVDRNRRFLEACPLEPLVDYNDLG